VRTALTGANTSCDLMTTQGFVCCAWNDEDLPAILRLYARHRQPEHQGIKTKEMAFGRLDWPIIRFIEPGSWDVKSV
jgi:hypothetical protein